MMQPHEEAYGDGLYAKLRALGVETVLVAGVVTNCCVMATAWHAMERNFQVVMLGDASAAAKDADHNAALTNCASLFGDVMLVDEVIEKLSPGAAAGALTNGSHWLVPALGQPAVMTVGSAKGWLRDARKVLPAR